MKTTRSVHTVPALIAAVLFALGLFLQPATAQAKDNWNHQRGYQKNGHNMPPGQYKKYYGNRHYYDRGGYYRPAPRYVVHEGHRGYWENRNGIQFFINLN